MTVFSKHYIHWSNNPTWDEVSTDENSLQSESLSREQTLLKLQSTISYINVLVYRYVIRNGYLPNQLAHIV
jgi:hypothetical protein